MDILGQSCGFCNRPHGLRHEPRSCAASASLAVADAITRLGLLLHDWGCGVPGRTCGTSYSRPTCNCLCHCCRPTTWRWPRPCRSRSAPFTGWQARRSRMLCTLPRERHAAERHWPDIPLARRVAYHHTVWQCVCRDQTHMRGSTSGISHQSLCCAGQSVVSLRSHSSSRRSPAASSATLARRTPRRSRQTQQLLPQQPSRQQMLPGGGMAAQQQQQQRWCQRYAMSATLWC